MEQFDDLSRTEDRTISGRDKDHSSVVITDHCLNLKKRELSSKFLSYETRKCLNDCKDSVMQSKQDVTKHKKYFAAITRNSSAKQICRTHSVSKTCSCKLISDNNLCLKFEMNTDSEVSDLDADDCPRNSNAELKDKLHGCSKSCTTNAVALRGKDGSSVDDENLSVSMLNVGTLWKQLIREQKKHLDAKWREEQLQAELLHQQMEFKHLMMEYNSLLQKHAKAENVIDGLKLLQELKNTDESKTRINDDQSCAMTRKLLLSSADFSDNGNFSDLTRTSDDDSWSFSGQEKYEEPQHMWQRRNSLSSEKEHSTNDLSVEPIKVKNDLSVDTARLHANWLLEELQLSFMAVQDDAITKSMKDEQITWLKHSFQSLKNDVENLKKSRDVRVLERMIRKINSCFKRLEDFRNNHFSEESSHSLSLRNESEPPNSNDKSSQNDKRNLHNDIMSTQSIIVQKRSNSSDQNLLPNQDFKLQQSEKQNPNWALFSSFKTPHNTSDVSKVTISHKNTLRASSEKVCCSDTKCNPQMRSDITIVNGNSSEANFKNERSVEICNSIGKSLNHDYIPSHTKDNATCLANNIQADHTHVQPTDPRRDRNQMATSTKKKASSTETVAIKSHKNEVSKLRLLTSLDSADQKAYHLHKKSIKILCDLFDMAQSDNLSKSILYY